MKKLADYINSRPIFFNTPPVPPPLRTSDEPLPAPTAGGGPRYIECDFCHCKLTKGGEVYSVSEIARDYRDDKEKHQKAVTKLDEEIAALRSQIAAKDAEIAELKSSQAPAVRKSGFL